MEGAEMDDTMGGVEGFFASEEFDLDYEFSAPHFFDFTKAETPLEAQEAEAWLDTAESYPPSPYLVNLYTREELLEVDATEDEPAHLFSTETRPTLEIDLSIMDVQRKELFQDNRTKDQNADVLVNYMQNSSENSFSTMVECLIHDCNSNGACKKEELSIGLVCDNNSVQVFHRSTQKASSSLPFLRSSTLMKPTASHLAKQKMPISRFPKDMKCSSRVTRVNSVLTVKQDKNADGTSCNECQASKRQKVEGGHTREVHQLHDAKQPVPLHHKEPKRVSMLDNHSNCLGPHGSRPISKYTLSVKDKCTEGIHAQNKLTVSREPILETARRARTRAKTAPDQDEHVSAKSSLFKAHPLNRKEFQLKTSERALQHSMAVSSTLSCINLDSASNMFSTAARSASSDTKLPWHLPTISSHLKSKGFDATKQLNNEHDDISKARPLNEKILSSKGNLGVYRNLKRETTKPMGFGFSTDKRFPQPNPPTELFNKLSLKSEVQSNYAPQALDMHKEKQQAFQKHANQEFIDGSPIGAKCKLHVFLTNWVDNHEPYRRDVWWNREL